MLNSGPKMCKIVEVLSIHIAHCAQARMYALRFAACTNFRRRLFPHTHKTFVLWHIFVVIAFLFIYLFFVD